MIFNHRTMAQAGRYALLAIASSGAVQLAILWPAAWAVIAGLAVVGIVYSAVFALRYYGLLSGARWAYRLPVENLDKGLIEFISFAVCVAIGVLVTCLMYWT